MPMVPGAGLYASPQELVERPVTSYLVTYYCELCGEPFAVIQPLENDEVHTWCWLCADEICGLDGLLNGEV